MRSPQVWAAFLFLPPKNPYVKGYIKIVVLSPYLSLHPDRDWSVVMDCYPHMGTKLTFLGGYPSL